MREIVSNGGEIKNFKSVKQETYRNQDFKSISERHGITRLVYEVVGLVGEVFREEMSGFERVILQMMGKLEGRVERLGERSCEFGKELGRNGGRQKGKGRRYSYCNN